MAILDAECGVSTTLDANGVAPGEAETSAEATIEATLIRDALPLT